jgi:hypothetical protein
MGVDELLEFVAQTAEAGHLLVDGGEPAAQESLGVATGASPRSLTSSSTAMCCSRSPRLLAPQMKRSRSTRSGG